MGRGFSIDGTVVNLESIDCVSNPEIIQQYKDGTNIYGFDVSLRCGKSIRIGGPKSLQAYGLICDYFGLEPLKFE